jgi:hypothetical protein
MLSETLPDEGQLPKKAKSQMAHLRETEILASLK